MTNRTNLAMAYAPSAPSPPNGAVGVITRIDAVVKAKKAGGTFTVNIATLDTGVEVDFGFKPVVGRIGDSVSWVTQKQYGTQKFIAVDPSAGSLPAAYPPRVSALAPSAPSTIPAYPSAAPAAGPSAYKPGYAKPFPLPREHGDTAIIRQNALTNAVKTITDAMSYTTKNGEARIAEFDTIEELEQRIIQTAYKFASFSSGQLDAMLASDIANSAAGK